MRFVLCDSGRFFKNGTAILGARAQDHIDLALLHHRVGRPCDAGVSEKILNVAKTAGRLVEKVFGIAIAVHAARHAHVVPINGQLFCAIGEGERDLCEPDRFARVAAVENNVGHLVAAERLG